MLLLVLTWTSKLLPLKAKDYIQYLVLSPEAHIWRSPPPQIAEHFQVTLPFTKPSNIAHLLLLRCSNQESTSNTTNNNKKISLKFSRKRPTWQIQWHIRGLFCKGPYRSRLIQFLHNTVKWQASVSRVMNRWFPLQQNTSSPTATVWRKTRHHTITCCLLPNSPQ
jgi:hypothetical protein